MHANQRESMDVVLEMCCVTVNEQQERVAIVLCLIHVPSRLFAAKNLG